VKGRNDEGERKKKKEKGKRKGVKEKYCIMQLWKF